MTITQQNIEEELNESVINDYAQETNAMVPRFTIQKF